MHITHMQFVVIAEQKFIGSIKWRRLSTAFIHSFNSHFQEIFPISFSSNFKVFGFRIANICIV